MDLSLKNNIFLNRVKGQKDSINIVIFTEIKKFNCFYSYLGEISVNLYGFLIYLQIHSIKNQIKRGANQMTETLENEVESKILEILSSNNAIMLATTGADYSPWILGAYYVNTGFDIYLLVEKNGKSFANIKENKNAAFSISQNDATKDFLQGKAVIHVLPDEQEAEVRAMLLEKMPWYQTFLPMTPLKIVTSKLFVTSLQKGWFPAKVLDSLN